jgi:hypothetical protein
MGGPRKGISGGPAIDSEESFWQLLPCGEPRSVRFPRLSRDLEMMDGEAGGNIKMRNLHGIG